MEKAASIVNAAIEEVNRLRPKSKRIGDDEHTKLFGRSGSLDSLGLVNLIVAIEEIAEDNYNASLTLGRETSLSAQEEVFATVGSLTAYVARLLDEGN